MLILNFAKSRTLQSFCLLALVSLVTACGGGGGNDSSSSTTSQTITQSAPEVEGALLGYADIAPILFGKCVGCHNPGSTALAPFSLEGEEAANSFKSAISFSLEDQSMPPVGALQLSQAERGQLQAWANGERYVASTEFVRIALVEAQAWDTQPKNRDAFFTHRPDEDIECKLDRGWFIEDGAVEVRTEFCNYASLGQQVLLDLEADTELKLNFSHSVLDFNAPSSAHVAISIGAVPIWEKTIAIPGQSNIYTETILLPSAIARGDLIELHIHNHGSNAWTLHSLEAVVPSDQQLDFCPSFESTFEAIQATVFEGAGCANSLCHGEAAEGGLDLSPAVAWSNIVGVKAEGSALNLIEPRQPDKSYLFHKLSEKTAPGTYAIGGAPMPSAGEALSPGQLEAIRLWIAAGAPDEGSVGDTKGQGEDELERLLGVCLPEPEPINVVPLPPPEPTKGIQFTMPPHAAPAEEETEICFAVYEDFRDQIPPEYMTEDREFFFAEGWQEREDPFTHHNVLFYSAASVDQIHDPSFGEWTCVGGEAAGELCEPTDTNSCGVGKCRSEIRGDIACRGYGPTPEGFDDESAPRDDALTGGGLLPIRPSIEKQGFYEVFPTHGIFYWNSHAFNLTTQDASHHVWRNFLFADDRRFQAERINDASFIFGAIGTQPFARKTVCRDFVFGQGDGLLSLASHFHKRGERFYMNLNGEQIYDNYDYEEPAVYQYDPPFVFNSADVENRTLEFCAIYNNGVNADDSPNIDTVTRASQRPPNAGACKPKACVAGNIGAPCDGVDDDSACDSSPGAGDGWCDACAIGFGITSDDEMFIMRGSRLANYDAVINAPGPEDAQVIIVSPQQGDVFAAGDVVEVNLQFENFDLLPPDSSHHHGGAAMSDGSDDHSHDDQAGSHSDDMGDHRGVTQGHYHVYLDERDDSGDHVTAWGGSVNLALPADILPGPHEIRVSLRAPDHHAVGSQATVTITVQ